MPAFLASLTRYSRRALALARHARRSPQEQALHWRESFTQALLRPAPEASQAIADLIRWGPPPGDMGAMAIRDAERLCASDRRGAAFLKALIDAGLHRDELDGAGISPLCHALDWQHLEAAELLAPVSSFATPGERGGQWHPQIAREGPLARAAANLDPECGQLCLRWMSPGQIDEQACHALRQLAWAMDLAQFRDADHLGRSLDKGSRRLSQTPPLERGARFAGALFASLSPLRLRLLPDMIPELSAGHPGGGSTWPALRVALEARQIELACAPQPGGQPPAARPGRARL